MIFGLIAMVGSLVSLKSMNSGKKNTDRAIVAFVIGLFVVMVGIILIKHTGKYYILG